MDKYKIDSHKLMYHIPRVNSWLSGENIYPIYMEISPSGSCNHRCTFCAYDFIGYPSRKLETNRFLSFLDEIAECGIRSLLYAGEGEPLLHPDIAKFIVHSKKNGIDVGMYTNAHILREELSEKILPFLTFVRISFNGGTRENYADIHRVKPDIFGIVIDNLKKSVNIRDKNKLDLDIGAQYVLLEENIDYLIDAIKLLKGLGLNYFVIKPFVQQSSLQFYQLKEQLVPEKINAVFDEAEKYSNEKFKVIARRESFASYGVRNYRHCYGTSFISCINSAGDIATCLPYWDKEEFIFGNIYQSSFKEIWMGEQRRKIKEFLENKLDTGTCPPNCRPNAVNEFLWEIKNPSVRHLNFA